MSGGAGRPGAVQRKLLIRSIPREAISLTLLHGALGENEHIDLDLCDYIDQEYLDEWKVLSHTFTLQPEGGALLTLLLEASV
jgi:hypothetical protein